MSTVREIVQRKGGAVLTMTSGETVFEAIKLMSDANVGAVLIREDDEVAGIFTERDYLKKIALKFRSSRETELASVMTSPVIFANPEDSVQHCLEVMTQCRCRHLPVLQEGELLGIVSIGDLVRQLLEEKEAEVEQLSHYISGNY